MSNSKATSTDNMRDDLLPEYNFDYSKVRPNLFAERMSKDSVVVMLDPDVAEVFKTTEAVNRILRAIITTMPSLAKQSG